MESPKPTPPPDPASNKPGTLLLVGTACLVAFNMLIGFAVGMADRHDVSYALGSAVGPVVFPTILATLFSIGKRFRNPRSRTQVVLWTSVLVLLSKIAVLVDAVGRH